MYKFINVWKSDNKIYPYQLDTNIYDNAADALKGYSELHLVGFSGLAYSYTYKIKDGENLSFTGEKVDVREMNNRAVFTAIEADDDEALQELVEAGYHLSVSNGSGKTAALLAASQGSVKCFKVLIKNGVSFVLVREDGATPAHMAAAKGKIEFLKALDKHGVDLHKATGGAGTPLNVAKSCEQLECVEFLNSLNNKVPHEIINKTD